METLGDELTSKTSKKEHIEFYCDLCDYRCFKKFNWDRHIKTSKHINEICRDKNETNASKNEHNLIFTCEFCYKEYQQKRNLWRHKKFCLSKNNQNDNVNGHKTDKLIEYLMKENSELRKEQSDIKQLILELVKNGTNNNNNTTNNNNITTSNSHNKAFNLNFFLNETCKNAMNITEFVDSIKLQLSDFMEVGEAGYVQGISNIIVKKLNALDETVRPIHCTDQKRETFYVKDENKWEKEEEDLKRIRKMIKRITDKNERLMMVYKEKYPDYNEYHSKRSDQYSMFVIEALGGAGDNTKEKENKIINHISKATTIKNKTK
jgi:hypothetical protein